MGIVMGLMAAFGWGAADVVARSAARGIGWYRALYFMQFVGLAGLSLYMLATGEFSRLDRHTPEVWLWALIAVSLSVIGSMTLYRALETGVLSIVAPIVSCYAALTVILAIVSGETLTTAHTLGIIATIGGVVLAATHVSTEYVDPEATIRRVKVRVHKKSGLLLALLTAALFGVFFWILGFHVAPTLGGVIPLWLIRIFTIVSLSLLAIPMRQSLAMPLGNIWRFIVGVGILDTVAYIAATISLSSQQVAIASVLISLHSAVTVVLVWLFQREPLQRTQWLGIALIIVGVILVTS